MMCNLRIAKALAAKFVAIVVVPMVFMACGSIKNISYFQDLKDGDKVTMIQPQPITVKSDDKLFIVVKSKDPELSNLFNLPIVSTRIGTGTRSAYDLNRELASYSVSSKGTIDFPILGKIAVAGKTREEIATLVKEKLIEGNLVKDPTVTVEFQNLHFSVLGEVAHPGQYAISHDQLTILDAISQAGDLTIYGKRDSVKVIRRNADVQTIYTVNLNSGSELLNSPVFYLQQNDIIYIDPNDTRKRQSTVNGNTFLSSSFWISVASLLTSVAVVVINTTQRSGK